MSGGDALGGHFASAVPLPGARPRTSSRGRRQTRSHGTCSAPSQHRNPRASGNRPGAGRGEGGPRDAVRGAGAPSFHPRARWSLTCISGFGGGWNPSARGRGHFSPRSRQLSGAVPGADTTPQYLFPSLAGLLLLPYLHGAVGPPLQPALRGAGAETPEAEGGEGVAGRSPLAGRWPGWLSLVGCHTGCRLCDFCRCLINSLIMKQTPPRPPTDTHTHTHRCQ